jgi:MFS family permease
MLAGRIGTLPVVVLGFGTLGLAALGAGLRGESMAAVQIALVLLGIGWSMVTVAGSALLTEVTPFEVRPRRQGQSDTVMNAAGAVFGAASGAIFAAGGFPVLAGVAGALVVLGISATALLRGRRDSVD